jgi:hypothetical protein
MLAHSLVVFRSAITSAARWAFAEAAVGRSAVTHSTKGYVCAAAVQCPEAQENIS